MRLIHGGLAGVLVVVMAAVAMLFGATTAPAAPAESTEQYVTSLEKICKRDFRRSSPIARGTRRLIERQRYRPAARRIIKTTRIFAGTIRRTRAIEPAAHDRAAVRRWFRLLDSQIRNLRSLAKVVRVGNKKRIHRLELKLLRGMNQANSAVFRFGFDRCKIPLDMFGP